MRRAFTLVEIMIVVLIIGLLLGIAVPQWIRARENSQSKSCIENLRKLYDAKEIFAHETNLSNGASVNMSDLWPDYISGSTAPQCPGGGSYTVNVVGANPECSVTGGTFPHILPF